MEAMASGLAVIATDCRSGPADLITEGRDGFLVPVDDAAAMARRLQQLMTDDGLRMRIASAATAAHERFAAATVAERWLVVLDQRREDPPCAA
jgi:glycosyltransferase involved in cell wall biosynthesis